MLVRRDVCHRPIKLSVRGVNKKRILILQSATVWDIFSFWYFWTFLDLNRGKICHLFVRRICILVWWTEQTFLGTFLFSRKCYFVKIRPPTLILMMMDFNWFIEDSFSVSIFNILLMDLIDDLRIIAEVYNKLK